MASGLPVIIAAVLLEKKHFKELLLLSSHRCAGGGDVIVSIGAHCYNPASYSIFIPDPFEGSFGFSRRILLCAFHAAG